MTNRQEMRREERVVDTAGTEVTRFTQVGTRTLARRIAPGLIALGVLACVLVSGLVFRFRGTMGPDSGARLLIVKNLVEHGRLSFANAVSDPYQRQLDPYAGYRVYGSTGAFIIYPVLFPALSALEYALFGDPGLVLLPIGAAALGSWILFRTAGRLELRAASWMPAILLLGTPLLVYASSFWDHSCIIAVSAVTTWFIVRAYVERDGTRALLMAGLACGAGVWVHELLMLLGISFGLVLLSDSTKRRQAWRFGVGLAIPLLALLAFNHVVYGTARGPHLLGPLDPTDPFKIKQLVSSHALVNRLVTELAGDAGPLDHVLALLVVAAMIASLAWRRIALAFAAMAAVIALIRLADSAVASGLFQATPWLVLALLGRRHGEARIYSVLRRASVCFGIATIATPITPGLNWGCRYLLTMLPALTLLALHAAEGVVEGLERRRVTWGAPAMVAFFAAAALVGATRSLRFYSNKTGFDQSHAEAVARLSNGVTATDLWWLAPELVPYHVDARLALVVDVPGSYQLPSSIPLAKRNQRIEETFFASLASSNEHAFSFIGSEPGRAKLEAAATLAGYHQVERSADRDLTIARFTR